MEAIPAKMLDQYVERRGYRIIDLRSYEEYLRGHIRGALSAPEGKPDTQLNGHKKDILILYCDRGARSMSVARELERKGWRTKTVVGGLRAYRGDNIVKIRAEDMAGKTIDRERGGH
ncbi:MAG: rhodanese-like domain-containing protein [Lachnospiraceae bacterium]|nr:rhodanese-like domain-containing protein [Lachnospiraceae bacterium]